MALVPSPAAGTAFSSNSKSTALSMKIEMRVLPFCRITAPRLSSGLAANLHERARLKSVQRPKQLGYEWTKIFDPVALRREHRDGDR